MDRNEQGEYQKGHSIPSDGRPTLYKDEYAEQAAKLVRLGATDHELADFFGIHISTVYRWKHDHSAFCDAVKGTAKEMADSRVERSLYSRSVGYSYESEKVFQFQGEIVRAPIIEHVQPDPSAALNWLKNRKPSEWREKQVVELEGEVKNKHALDDEGKEFLKELAGVRTTD